MLLDRTLHSASIFLVLRVMTSEHLRVVPTLRLKVEDHANIADQHDRREDRHISQSPLVALGFHGFDLLYGSFLRFLGKRINRGVNLLIVNSRIMESDK